MIEKEFNLLYAKYRDTIVRYYFKKIDDIETAKDLTHDVFACFYNAYSKGMYKEDGYLKTYLFTISHNLYINYVKSKYYLSEVRVINKSIHIGVARDSTDIHEEYCHKEELDNVMRILHELPDFYIDTFNLKVFGDMKLKDIALLQNISINTVKSRLFFCDLFLKKRGFDFLKHKKKNKARQRKERTKKAKLVRSCIA